MMEDMCEQIFARIESQILYRGELEFILEAIFTIPEMQTAANYNRIQKQHQLLIAEKSDNQRYSIFGIIGLVMVMMEKSQQDQEVFAKLVERFHKFGVYQHFSVFLTKRLQIKFWKEHAMFIPLFAMAVNMAGKEYPADAEQVMRVLVAGLTEEQH